MDSRELSQDVEKILRTFPSCSIPTNANDSGCSHRRDQVPKAAVWSESEASDQLDFIFTSLETGMLMGVAKRFAASGEENP
jgi:hypothetical protein